MLNGSLEEDEADVFNFIACLRQENLFIRSEKQDIHDLNKLIANKIHNVVKTSWLTNKQRFFLLEKRNKHLESITLQSCANFDVLTTYRLDKDFVDAKNALGSQNAINISNLLHILRSQPKQLAEWLLMGEKITEEQEYRLIIQSVINGLYGSCIFAEDAKYMLTLLFEVARQQLLGCDEPRSVIKKRTCTFRHLFFLFDEVYQPAKFFLSAALELPILELLSFNQYYLDVDHDKSIQRFRSEDNLKSFHDAVEYRNEVVARLGQFTNNFVQSMLENVYSFPKPLAWIACHIYKMIEKAFCAKEANAVTTELIFNTFIVPIIVDPEQYGIHNSQISDIARHNLIQIAKILQILALSKFEGIDKKYMDIFQKVDKNSMSNFVELLFFDMESNEPPVDASPNILRDIMLFTEEELHILIGFLQKIQIQRNQNDNVEKNPTVMVTIEEHLSLLTVPSRNHSPRMNGEVNNHIESSPQKKTFFSLGAGAKNIKRLSDEIKERPSVIVFPIDGVSFEPVGMLPEDKVIDLSVPVKTEAEVYAIQPNLSSMKDISIVENGVSNCDVKSTYSNYQDEGSIGNTSDNLEAISEAASNHSVASSLELENEDQNDNLSDMVSANVSGRGTPNISGRDTPSSQVNENEDRQNAENRQENVEEARPPPPPISRQIRSEIDDKFCKFEIKKLLAGDETISLISETWSTDVLASDNETVDLSERMSFPITLADQAIQEAPSERERENVLDVSETQSESAWSTDVMGSDTERMTEVDNDDAASVAQSDDTNSVPRSDDTRSETDEVAGLRRLSSCSSNYNNSAANQVPTSSVQGYIANVSVNNINYVNVTANSPSYVTTTSTSFLTNVVNVKTSETTAKFVSVNQNYMAATSTFKKVEFDTRAEKSSTASEVDGNANNIFKSVSQQTQTVSYDGSSTTRAFSDRTQGISKTMDPNVAGPSGLNRKASLNESDTSTIKQNGVRKYENNRTNEILLSNCSLNSSSSGSSSNSFENKNSMNELSNSDQWETKPWLNSSGSSLNVTLTPSESTSELSVLSAANAMSQSVTTNGTGAVTSSSVTRKSSTVLSKGLKVSPSGAIAKSISFDMSVEKGLDDDNNRSKRGGGFFGKIRNGFKARRGKGGVGRVSEDYRNAGGDFNRSDIGDSPVKHGNIAEVPDDILAKYRSKDFIENSPVKEGSREKRDIQNGNRDSSESDVNTFSDIKKKLRLVLCNTSEVPYYLKRNPCSIKSKLETVLRLELGRARKLRDWSVVARISESLRCISLLDEKGCMKLIHSMKDDIILRSTYIQYLIASKRELLFCQMYLDNLQEQIKHDRHQCEAYVATLCVREFLQQQEVIITEFYNEFSQLTLTDEKYDLIQRFYRKLYTIINESGPWHDVLRKRGKVFEVILERYIISRVYATALYPNGDGDIDRDRVLHKHIENLSKVVTPEHKDLMIPKIFLRESPWLPAQDALRALNACRTPKDKLKCIKRCGRGIMDLLSISTGYPAADEFLPVLVYVIIKVNPEALLSTIQFVNSFQGQIKDGEEEYWWTGFCAAVEIIKNMDYSD